MVRAQRIARRLAQRPASRLTGRGGGGGTPEVTFAAVREYLFEPSAELVDTGLDASNATNVNSVTFSGGVATFDKANARHLTYDANAGALSQLKEAIGYGARIDFLGITIPSIAAHHHLFGNTDDSTTKKAINVVVDAVYVINAPAFSQGKIVLLARDSTGGLSVFEATDAFYSDGELFDLSIVFNLSTDSVTVTKNGSPVAMTTVLSGCKIGEVAGYQYVGRIGAQGRAAAFATYFDGTLDGVRVNIDGVGAARFATLDQDTKPFNSGDDGYNTYRIPAICSTPDYSEVLVFTEGRVNSSSDNGDVDIVLRKSSDGGATWGSIISIANDGNTNSDPSPVYDENGRLHLFWVWRRSFDSAFSVINGTASEPMRVYHSYSDDDGDTWSARADITSSVAPTGYRRIISGGQSAIRLSSGRILWLGGWTENNTTDTSDKQGCCFYSDDNCATFTRGATYGPLGADEVVGCQVADGTVIINQRDQKDGRKRLVGTSTDGGETIADLVADNRLICPRNNAGILAIGNTVYFTNTAVNLSNVIATHRRNLLLRRGTWNGTSIDWQRYQLINAGLSGYSKIAQIGANKLGIVWEDGSSTTFGGIKFQSFDI